MGSAPMKTAYKNREPKSHRPLTFQPSFAGKSILAIEILTKSGWKTSLTEKTKAFFWYKKPARCCSASTSPRLGRKERKTKSQIFRASNKVFEAQKKRQESNEDNYHSDRVQSIPRPPLILPIGR